MDNMNYLFYQEFAKLDQSCQTIYQNEDGICNYIAEMAGVSVAYGATVPNWTEDLDQLYRYHMIYNALAQRDEAFQELLCCQADIDWIRQFHDRIMERQAPLAVLQENGYHAADDARHRLEDLRIQEEISAIERDDNGRFAVWIIIAAVFLTCLICVMLMRSQ